MMQNSHCVSRSYAIYTWQFLSYKLMKYSKKVSCKLVEKIKKVVISLESFPSCLRNINSVVAASALPF